MSFELVITDSFERSAKSLAKRFKSSFKADIIQLRAELLSDPRTGEPLGRDCYKVRVRIASKGKGKSGGARAITCVKIIGEQIFLLTIYDKSEQESISDKERDELLRENELL
ncbi:type II toxin-antitoxin system RelE/ParE family toxin [Hymenobacter coccineus]|uniref:type II toxin-antitoxin system RelE/ParE family toxin n=1 Tax=Hymenobacter coccineus TaxID=1908235 RepID=UPI0009F6CD5B|nr:type II toxin-antitoxin system RelE/ParE family toxin [Hymenobacter coccineus]